MPGGNPTLKEVAKRAGTSIATASVVLSNDPKKYVSEELRRRVVNAARELHYRTNITARRMKGKSGRFLAILVPQFENVYFHRIVIGAESYANMLNYTLSIFSTHDQEERELAFIENLISLQVDGVLISPSVFHSRSVQLLQKVGIPFVVIDRPVDTADDYDLVSMKYFEAGYRGAQLLLESGHRRIAFLGWGHPMQSLSDRKKGFQQAIIDAGIDPVQTPIWEGALNPDAAYEATCRILKDPAITAIFAGHHLLGEGVVRGSRDLKRATPDDVSVLIFGNPGWATITNPRYSCIAQPDLKIGEKATELIIDSIQNPLHKKDHYWLDYELFERDSILSIEKR
jgi:DNA-binding LacI/PurR family transcriptional regulator